MQPRGLTHGVPQVGTNPVQRLPQLPARLRMLLPGQATGRTTSEPKPRPRAEGTGRQFIILIAFVWGNLERMRVDVRIL